MKIVYFASGIRGLICLKALLENNYEITALVSNGDDSKLLDIGKKYSILHIENSKPNTAIFAEKLKKLKPDLFVLSGYNKILKPQIYSIPPLGTINLHGGKLPQYRGAAPINWQIINGESEGGCCILYVDEGIDTGPLLHQEKYTIEPEDTHASVLKKTLEIFPRILLQVIGDIESNSIQGIAQDSTKSCHYTRRYPEDSKILWSSMIDQQVHNLVRAMHGPYPPAFTYCKDEKVEIIETSLLAEEIRGISGRIPLKRSEGVVAICLNRGIIIRKIKVNGELVDPCKYFNIGDNLE